MPKQKMIFSTGRHVAAMNALNFLWIFNLDCSHASGLIRNGCPLGEDNPFHKLGARASSFFLRSRSFLSNTAAKCVEALWIFMLDPSLAFRLKTRTVGCLG